MWRKEFDFVRAFGRDLESRPPLPVASAAELEAHAAQVVRLQDLFALIASLPPAQRPPVGEWDDAVSPLWRRLFAKGDDIDRYTLAEPWYRVLVEAGETDRALRALTGRMASARNFRHYDEALALSAEGRRLCVGRPSGALANLLNTEGSVHYCRRDFEAAERSYSEALGIADLLDDGACRTWIGVDRRTFRGQETFNILCAFVDLASASKGRARALALAAARERRAFLDTLALGGDFWSLTCVADVEMALAEGDGASARTGLTRLDAEAHRGGPYTYSLLATLARLHSRLLAAEGDWAGAYGWVRKALQASTQNNYPAEEQLVLDQAVEILRHLQGGDGARSGRTSEMVGLLEDKDWYTGRSHSRSVSRLATRVARAANETREAGLDVQRVATAGLLHDIGKLRCPWSLLNKIAPITPRERSLLHDHSAHGAALLRDLGVEEPLCVIVEEHHECLDGSGYPNGRAPSMEGAIVGLCDIFEAAVTPNRRYKSPKTREEILAEIRSASGRLHPPVAVEGLARVVERSGERH